MPKLKLDDILRKDLEEYLDKHSDFGFELKVLKMLRSQNLACEHGGHYVDPVTGKSREFDIRAKKTIGKFRVRIAVECKNVRKNFPILVTQIPRQDYESFHDIAMVGEIQESPYEAMTRLISRASIYSISGNHTIYPQNEWTGKNLVQVGRSSAGEITANDGEIYEKWSQCLSSLNDLIKEIYWDGGNNDSEDHYLSTAIPILVVPEKRLWAVRYDDNGTRVSEPKEIERCSIYIGKDQIIGDGVIRKEFTVSHLEIMTVNGLNKFVEKHLKSEEGISGLLPWEGIHEIMNTADS